MTSVILACLWVIAAHVIVLFPSRDKHWRISYVLVTVGLPILVYVIYQNGIVLGLIVLAGAMSILRWPVIYLMRWLRRVLLRREAGE